MTSWFRKGQIFMLKHHRPSSGFTLIEIMLVTVILLSLVAVVGPRIMNSLKQANIRTTRLTLNNTKTAINQFLIESNRYPTTEEGLQSLVTCPSGLKDGDTWNGPYVTKLPKDAWKRDLKYTYPSSTQGQDFDLISAGPDGQFGTEDDVIPRE